MQWWLLMVFQNKQWVSKNKLLLRELHFLSSEKNLTICWATYNGSTLKLLCVELLEIVVSLFTDSLKATTGAHFVLKASDLIDLFLCEIGLSFQVKF